MTLPPKIESEERGETLNIHLQIPRGLTQTSASVHICDRQTDKEIEREGRGERGRETDRQAKGFKALEETRKKVGLNNNNIINTTDSN